MQIMKKLLLAMMALVLMSCGASDSDKAIEEARFLLDRGEFTEAIAKLEPIVDDDPSNLEATFMLATAYIGQASDEPRPRCTDEETGVLGILACYLRTKDDDDRLGVGTFARVAPAELNEVNNLDDGIALLQGLNLSRISRNNTFSAEDVYAILAISRMFELSSVITIAQANTGDESDCDADEINEAQAQDFRDNLEQIDDDLQNAGFPSDFRLFTRTQAIFDTLANAGFTDNTIAVRTIVADAFSNYSPPCACASCEQAVLDNFDPDEVD